MIHLRMCTVCRAMKPKAELIRVVKAKDSAAAIDLTYKAAGRGAYVCRTADCIGSAQKKRVLERAFKGKVEQQLYEELVGVGVPDDPNKNMD